MRQLEVGDKVYNIHRDGFNDFQRYTFSEVVRLTKTLAILENGVRLTNLAKTSWISEDICYSVYRDYWTYWHLTSEKAMQNAAAENEKIAVYDWFEGKVFSLKEKQSIYKMFQDNGKVVQSDGNQEKETYALHKASK
ncbi:pyruvate kinase [Sediminicola arcticus]|uniref:Pyruvate kinase n=1 Tax=Sediminicola arcticus TaxID=1574308 RepID=A0ABV2SV13_9FLAO